MDISYVVVVLVVEVVDVVEVVEVVLVVDVVVGGIGITSHDGAPPPGTQGDFRSAAMSLKHMKFTAHVLKFPRSKTPFESHGKYCVRLKQAKPLAHVLQAAP